MGLETCEIETMEAQRVGNVGEELFTHSLPVMELGEHSQPPQQSSGCSLKTKWVLCNYSMAFQESLNEMFRLCCCTVV